jgi:uncharacterized protein YbaA (DUF1428 family)
MTYIEGFIAAVPIANKDAYVDHATGLAPLIRELGATRMVESWSDDVPEGKVTDFRKSVQAKDDEAVVFSWFEYPDRAARDAANEKMMSDPRMKEMGAGMPFDGKRLPEHRGGLRRRCLVGPSGAARRRGTSSSSSDGVDAPRRHRRAKVVVFEDHLREASVEEVAPSALIWPSTCSKRTAPGCPALSCSARSSGASRY